MQKSCRWRCRQNNKLRPQKWMLTMAKWVRVDRLRLRFTGISQVPAACCSDLIGKLNRPDDILSGSLGPVKNARTRPPEKMALLTQFSPVRESACDSNFHFLQSPLASSAKHTHTCRAGPTNFTYCQFAGNEIKYFSSATRLFVADSQKPDHGRSTPSSWSAAGGNPHTPSQHRHPNWTAARAALQ